MAKAGEFTIKTLREQNRMALEELRFYHQELLKNQSRNNDLSYFLKVKKRMIFLIKLILKIERLSQKRALKVIGDKSYTTNKPRVYLFTTAGNYDVETALEVASGASIVNITKKQPISSQMETLLLMANRLLETDGFLSKEEITRYRLKNLASGNHDISFPELIPNNCPFAPVNQLNPNIADLIITSDATVIPVALEQCTIGNRVNCLVNIGENFNLSGIRKDYIDDVLKIIYDELTKLKEEIWLNMSASNMEAHSIGSNFENLLKYKNIKQNRLIKTNKN